MNESDVTQKYAVFLYFHHSIEVTLNSNQWIDCYRLKEHCFKTEIKLIYLYSVFGVVQVTEHLP